jgi:hypothetical protein
LNNEDGAALNNTQKKKIHQVLFYFSSW